MMDINNLTITGHLTADPELRHTPKGFACCNLRIAINRSHKSSEGALKEETIFIDVVAWKEMGELCHKHLVKGKRVGVTGRLVEDVWTDKQSGQPRSKFKVNATEVIFLSPLE
jgi:single-strand DNA-binding protein